MAKISFIAADGCGFSGISGLIDSFSIANLWHSANTGKKTEPLFEMEILSPNGKAFCVNGGYQITPDGSFMDIKKTDLIIIPSFLPNVELLRENAKDMLDWIMARYEHGVSIAALCTGSFVLAETGLLDGRLATTNWIYARLFRRRYPKVLLKPERILTQDNGLICTGAVSAFYNLGLHFIEVFGSSELASQCSKALLVDSNRISQSSYVIFNAYKGHGDDKILKAQQWMEFHLTEYVNMENLAEHVGISPRHFIRRFKKATSESPLNYLQQMRIEKAKKILETRTDTVDEITQAIGYENSSTFRKLFKECTGLSPREYRNKFTRQKHH
jgi:transcriptional regulator GlxA family with amidase domain